MSVSSANNNMFASFAKNNIKTQTANKTEKVGKSVELSDKAKSYLNKLKEKFGNVDFIIADYSTDEEANKKLKSGNGEYNCIITPDLLEKMAADDEVAAKYESIISDSTEQLDGLKETVNEKGLAEKVKSYGISVDGNGKVNYYILLRDGLEKFNANKDEKNVMNKDNEDKTDNKENIKDKRPNKTTAIYADSITELLKKLEDYSEGKSISHSSEKNKDGLEIVEKENKAVIYSRNRDRDKDNAFKVKNDKKNVIAQMLQEQDKLNKFRNQTEHNKPHKFITDEKTNGDKFKGKA